MVSCNFELTDVGERALLKEVLQNVESCQKTRRVCAFTAQLSSACHFSEALSSVKSLLTLVCMNTLTN